MEATPLRNADFRALLSTPRAQQGFKADATPKAGATPKRKQQPPKPKPKVLEEGEDADLYRDRAEERRRGINPDYAAATQLLTVMGQTDNVDATKLSVEQSKFLGGDLDHTHLVKGLDFALLQKMKEAAAKKKAEEDGTEGDEQGAAAGSGVRPEAAFEKLEITHPVARGIYSALFIPHKSNVRESFNPRRMAFVYDFEAGEEGLVLDIPTTLRRSKADCPPAVEAVFTKVDTQVLDKIAKIMSYIKTGAGGKKFKKKERDELVGELVAGGLQQQAASTPTTPRAGPVPPSAHATPRRDAAEEEDIFADAGLDYKPSVTGRKKVPGTDQGVDMDLEDGEMGPLPPPPPSSQLPYVQGDPYYVQQQQFQQYQQQYEQNAQVQPMDGDEPKWRVRTKKVEERAVDFVDDAYGEYYQLGGGAEVPALNGDDDEPLEGKAAKAAARAAELKDKSSTRGKDGESTQKINQQLQKIENLFKDKGWEDASAFGRTPGRGGATPGRGGATPRLPTGDDPNLATPSMHKKRRI